MNFINRWKYLVVAAAVILAVFIATSLFDVVLAVIYSRFYSTAAFITIFGVGGIFAGFLSYSMAVDHTVVKNEFTRWSIIVLMIASGISFFIFLSVLEGGEYEVPLKAFGITLALTSLFFVKTKMEF